ncbi:hypothetical protein Mgra_00006502 [Meloidogyne graminicola]|uniref:Uncharacterized protein n=1 Tax=Meloidogyne graminicola TaxID=189291 RepID=A0A8S9ZLB0_9BILA|nr:hypothetical protein Mgra_00006502 [Meloidogyne graminicola]
MENKENKEYKHAVVQGAGPIGLYAAFKLFIEGINVTLVNNRSEEYIRNQLVIFDRKWMLQLPFFLGTVFDKLFIEKGSKGKMLDEELGLINIKYLETELKNQLNKISKYVEEQQKNTKEKSFLKLIFEAAVLDIKTNKGVVPLAVLGTPKKQGKAFELKNLEKELNYLNGKYIDDSEGGKVVGIPFDLFFCAGGASDQIRNKHLEPPKSLTESVNYGVTIFDKKFTDNIFEAASYTKPVSEMERFIKEQNIEKLISQAKFLPKEFIKKYLNITEEIIGKRNYIKKKCATKRPFSKFLGSNEEKIVINLFETNPTLYMSSNTPKALVNFIEEFKNERKKVLKGQEEKFKKI